jgi:hypothetical protein
MRRFGKRGLFLMVALVVVLLGAAILAPVAGATTADVKEPAASVQAAPHAYGEPAVVCVYDSGCLVYIKRPTGIEPIVRNSFGTRISIGLKKVWFQSAYKKESWSGNYFYYYESEGWIPYTY